MSSRLTFSLRHRPLVKFSVRRKTRKLPGLMSKEDLRSALVRSIILEYQNAKAPGMLWGYDAPQSMYVARRNRKVLAITYSRKYDPVSRLLFQRKIPSGNQWKGAGQFVSFPIYTWVNDVWTHIACSVPFDHCTVRTRASFQF